jgi:hypothetical protein
MKGIQDLKAMRVEEDVMTTAVDTLRADRAALLEIGGQLARLSSDAAAFVRWVTQRGSWAELGVQASGDEAQLAIARALHVF